MLHGIGSALTQIDFCQVIHLRLWSTMARERVLFIGTQFSILYTSMYSPDNPRTRVLDVCGFV